MAQNIHGLLSSIRLEGNKSLLLDRAANCSSSDLGAHDGVIAAKRTLSDWRPQSDAGNCTSTDAAYHNGQIRGSY